MVPVSVLLRRLPLVLVVTALTSCGPRAVAEPDPKSWAHAGPDWHQVDTLVGDEKYQQALTVVERLVAGARAPEQQAAALIERAKLTISLGGYETAVTQLKASRWPDSPVARAVVALYYAHALTTYAQVNSWQISRREQVAAPTSGMPDLKTATREQIYAELLRTYDELLQAREALGSVHLGSLGGYVEKNDYPAKVRGTLRDAISYFVVAALADTAFWRADQSNDLYQLDLAKLLGGTFTLPHIDAAAHPLERLAAVLDDLSRWHQQHGEGDGALEAFLARAQALYGAFSDADQRATIRRAVEARLDGERSTAWWSMGMARLAQMYDDAGDPVRAHQLAAAGEKAHPHDMGGRAATAIRQELEAPRVELSSMRSDNAHRRSLLVEARNVPKLYFRAYARDLAQTVRSTAHTGLDLSRDELSALLQTRPVAEWASDLPATPDFRSHRSFVTPPLDKLGLYEIVASLDSNFSAPGVLVKSSNLLLASPLLLTRLLTAVRTLPGGGAELTVLDGESGRALPGVRVDLYRYEWGAGQHAPVATLTSDAQGHVSLTSGTGGGGSLFFVAQRDGDATVQYGVYTGSGYTPTERPSALCFTDRSIYRPLQTIDWKILAYQPDHAGGGSPSTLRRHPLDVQLFDANGQEVDKRHVTTNDYGTAAGSFTIPAGRLLGSWTVRALDGSTAVRVEEYKRPTFEVTFRDPTTALRLNQPAQLTGEAKYYFGLPVTAGSVKWRVTRVPVFPLWWEWYGWGGGENRNEQTIATGSAPLGSDGTFTVKFTPAADPSAAQKAVTYRYQVSADLTDEGGETRSAERTVRLGFAAVEVNFDELRPVLVPDESMTVTVRRTNLDGVARAGSGSYRLLALNAPAKAAIPADLGRDAANAASLGDHQRARWETAFSPAALIGSWTDGAGVAQGSLTHDATGAARFTVGKLAPGAYRLRYHTVDEFGQPADAQRDFVVVGGPSVLPLPAALWVDQSTVQVGQMLRVTALSGLPDQPLTLEIYQDGALRERRTVDSHHAVLSIPITARDRGGLAFRLWGARDHQWMTSSASVNVPHDDKQLTVSLSTFRDKIRPGAKEVWRVHVAAADGKSSLGGAAEVLAYMYDRSLDLFAPHHPVRPIDLFPSRSAVPWIRTEEGSVRAYPQLGTTLPSYYPQWPHGDSLNALDGGYVGGPGRRRMMMKKGAAPGAAGVVDRAMPMPAPPSPVMAEPTAQAEEKKPSANTTPPADSAAAGKAAPPPGNVPVRSNFSETAFFTPQLLTDAKGDATLEFTVPDSVTSWTVWAHAISRDLASGSTSANTRSVKELMVRPYLPRFFREGDTADLKVEVNNAGDQPLSGTLGFDLIDPATKKSVAARFGLANTTAAFAVAPGKSQSLTFSVTAPKLVGTYAVVAKAQAGAFSDGELRPLPVLPSRLHLMQSRFVALHDGGKRTVTFNELARDNDPSRTTDQLVVTVDAQLFFSVLRALPYLISYPYECNEQTLNRFLSTALVARMFATTPSLAAAAKEMSARRTRLAPWDANDPNRKMAAEETPWLNQSEGNDSGDAGLINMLDPQVVAAQQTEALAKLRKSQLPSGAFPWFDGGPPSPYITLYLMYGFAKASEFGVVLPKEMVQSGWSYLAEWVTEELSHKESTWDPETLTFLVYVASSYPDPSWMGSALPEATRQKILAFAFAHWRKLSPYTKSFLALALKRAGRASDGKLVWSSVMDSAKSDRDLGTYWAPEERSWLWYNDTIETQAMALRTLTELEPQNPQRAGLVQWLFLNKKLNQWKSTRATAEVLYSLLYYLKAEQELGIHEAAHVQIGARSSDLDFPAEHYVGKQEVVVPGAEVTPKDADITIEQKSKGFMFASATWHFATDKLPTESSGDFFTVDRSYFVRENDGQKWVLHPLKGDTVLHPGDEVEVHLALTAKHAAEYVHLRDPRAAGLEPENPVSHYSWDSGVGVYEETRDSGANFFFEQLPVGQYTFTYRLRANVAGRFRVGPAQAQSMYAPEFTAYSAGQVLEVRAPRQ